MMKHLLIRPWALISLLALAACQSSVEVAEKPVQASSAAAEPSPYQPLNPQYIGVGLLTRPDVQRFIDHRVRRGGFSRAELEVFFGNTEHKQNIISIMDRPGTARPWYVFRQGNVGGRIQGGDRFWKQNVAVINEVAQHYGVPAELIVAIIGIETNYGGNMGSFRLGDALTTLAFSYPRRAEFFQQELDEFLQLAHEERRDVFTFKGSYAGAMGMPQFMPSSYRKWAVDWDKDGRRDIWNNVGDVSASVANYMKQHGWQTGAPMAVPVSLDMTSQLQALIDSKTELKHTVGDLRRMGVRIPAHIGDAQKAVLFQLEVAPGSFEYWVGLNNFYTVWQYNHSRLYVSAVREIANGLRGGHAGL